MAIFNKVANTAAVLSIASNVFEAGKMGAKNAKSMAKTELAVKDIRDLTGDMKLNKPSDKYSAMKEMVRGGDVTAPLYKAKGAVIGFFKGAYEGMKGNWLNTGFAALTLATKNKTMKTIGVVGCGVTTAWNFIKNGTNLFTDKSTIEK